MKNPITELTGPEFLVFYAIVIAVMAAICWWRRQSSDSAASLPLPSLPERADPYEIAYLRGGENELARVAIVRLSERGHLCVEWKNKEKYEKGSWRQTMTLGLGATYDSEKYVVQKPHDAKAEHLNPLERCVFQWFEPGRKIGEVFAGGELTEMLKSHTLQYEEKLHAEHLLTSDELKVQGRLIAFIGAAVVAVIGGSRLYVGLLRDRPVGFLIMMGLAGSALRFIFPRPTG